MFEPTCRVRFGQASGAIVPRSLLPSLFFHWKFQYMHRLLLFSRSFGRILWHPWPMQQNGCQFIFTDDSSVRKAAIGSLILAETGPELQQLTRNTSATICMCHVSAADKRTSWAGWPAAAWLLYRHCSRFSLQVIETDWWQCLLLQWNYQVLKIIHPAMRVVLRYCQTGVVVHTSSESEATKKPPIRIGGNMLKRVVTTCAPRYGWQRTETHLLNKRTNYPVRWSISDLAVNYNETHVWAYNVKSTPVRGTLHHHYSS